MNVYHLFPKHMTFTGVLCSVALVVYMCSELRLLFYSISRSTLCTPGISYYVSVCKLSTCITVYVCVCLVCCLPVPLSDFSP